MAARVNEGAFRFLQREECFGGEPDWHAPQVSQLWRYHLHYFAYVRSLLVWAAAGRSEEAYLCFRRLVLSWIAGNALLRGDGWHPYTLSLRLVNWLQAAVYWRDRLERDPAFYAAFADSMQVQAELLFRQIERDVRGNHILENLRALLWAGCAFEGAAPTRWFQAALDLLEAETREQILEDGAHFERTPGYHVVVLRNYIEIGLLLDRNASGAPGWLRDAVLRQTKFLVAILGPAQRVPLLKDTASDAFPPVDGVLAAAAIWLQQPMLAPEASPALEPWLLFGETRARAFAQLARKTSDSGFVAGKLAGFCIARSADEHLVVDAGKPCPDYLPAHAHADALTYEYHYRGRPVVVDSGVYEYRQGEWRDFFRSTRAHNTVEIDGENSSEVWSSFRVGRRARVTVTDWRVGTGEVGLVAHHDGYRFLAGRPVHRRAFFWERNSHLLVLDRIEGQGEHAIANYVHFHPDIDPRLEGDALWRIDVAGASLWLHRVGLGPMESSVVRGRPAPSPQGWYAERFGRKEANAALVFSVRAPLPCLGGYVLSPMREVTAQLREDARGIEIALSVAGKTRSWRIAEGKIVV